MMKTLIVSAALLALAASAASAAVPQLPQCRADQLRLSLDDRDGDFNGMSHSGTELSIRNLGRDCMLPGLPVVQFRDARGRVLPAARRAPIGMQPGPVVLPVRISGGHRATTDLRWVSGPVFDHSRNARARSVSVTVGNRVIRAPLRATLYGEAGRAIGFEQAPLHAVEGMAAHSA